MKFKKTHMPFHIRRNFFSRLTITFIILLQQTTKVGFICVQRKSTCSPCRGKIIAIKNNKYHLTFVTLRVCESSHIIAWLIWFAFLFQFIYLICYFKCTQKKRLCFFCLMRQVSSECYLLEIQKSSHTHTMKSDFGILLLDKWVILNFTSTWL